MTKHLSLSIVAILLTATMIAQENPKIKTKTFFSSTIGKESAKKNLSKGEHYYKKGEGFYDEALKYYTKAYHYNNLNHALNYKIGVCYLLGNAKESSLNFFLNSAPSVAKDYYYLLATAYQYNNQFDKAISTYNTYLSTCSRLKLTNAKSLVNQKIRECEFSKSIINDTVPVFIKNLGPIVNSYYDDYNAILSPFDSTLYFTTRRPKVEPDRRVSRYKFKESLVKSGNPMTEDVDFITQNIGLKSSKNTSLAGFSKTENKLFFYRGKKENGAIYVAEPKGKRWKEKSKLGGNINHIAYHEGSVSLDEKNNIYYVSNRRGGEGGNDIWFAEYKKKNKWKKSVNIGAVINTPFDEISVYVTPDGNTLYFSSNGHLGMGGYDVYKSERTADGSWGTPQNLGYPINSPANELFYHPTDNPNIALYSTTRSDGYGGLDIYSITKDTRTPFWFNCSIIDFETEQPIDASVTITDSFGEIVASGTSKNTELPFKHRFEDIGTYIVKLNSEGYKTITDTIKCPSQRNDTISKLFATEKIRHPFTIAGRVTNIDNNSPLAANIVFKDSDNNVIGITTSSGLTGNYVYSFEDKVDLMVEANATDYYSMSQFINTTENNSATIKQDFQLKTSRIDYIVRGRVTSADEQKPIYAALSFYEGGSSTIEKIVVTDSLTGNYNVVLNTNNAYYVVIEAAKHFFANDTISFGEKETIIARNYNLKKMETGAKLVIENILFNSGKATLKPQSFGELDKFATLLIKNPSVNIEVSGHTDNVGSASINKKISRERALTVKNYLISKGVEAERITHAGYGFDQPIAPNDTEAGREQNRRVEIKVIK